jgi:hypothetical protein
MLITACPDPECGAPAEITLWAVATSTNGPVPHVRTLCVNKHSYLLPATWTRSHDTCPAPVRDAALPGRPAAGEAHCKGKGI